MKVSHNQKQDNAPPKPVRAKRKKMVPAKSGCTLSAKPSEDSSAEKTARSLRRPIDGKLTPVNKSQKAPPLPAKRERPGQSSRGAKLKTPIVKNITIKDEIEDFLDSLNVPAVDPSDDKALTTLGEFLVSLDAQIRVGDTDILDRGKGALSWLQGKVLSRVYPLDRKRFEAVAKRGQWGEFLKKYWKYSPSTAYWCRRIYETWHDSLLEVKRLGYTGCIEQLLAMYDVDDEGNVVKPGASGSDPSDGGDTDQPGDEPPKDDPSKKPLTTIGTLLKQLSTTTAKLVSTATEMPESFFAPEKEIQLIKDFITSVDGVILNMRRAQDRLRDLKLKSAEQVLADAKEDDEVDLKLGDIDSA